MTRTGLILDDRYQLAEPIAAGGVGQVWRASDLLLDREVAVKLLRPEYADHPDTLERFRAEAKHAGSLTHPCVARVYDYGNAGPASPPYLVMEYVNGPSLADMLAVDPVHPVLALDVAAQAAAGLDAAHSIGLVHRDVKPGNILIGADGLVKITDFGIAHAAGSAPITGPGLVMGTTQYMAPERIAGGQATPASDLYALGILIYECLTGLPPYDGGTAEVMAGHLYLPMPPLPAGVPPELGELVTRLTAKDPAARLSDAAEVAAIATRLRDALAADAGLTVAAPAYAGAATGSHAGAGATADVEALFTGPAPRQAGPGMTGQTGVLDDRPPQAAPTAPAARHAAGLAAGPARQDRTAARDDARGRRDRARGRRGGLAAGQRGAARLAGRGPRDGIAARHHRSRRFGVAGAARHGAGAEPFGGQDVRAAEQLRHGQRQPPGDAQPEQQPGEQRVPQPVRLAEPLPRADPDDHVTGALADAPAAADLPQPVGTGVPGEPRARSE